MKKHKEKSDKPVSVLMKTTLGDITMELYPDKAPVTVENFISYVKDGFYDGLIFHRVIGGFMIQGGGFYENLERKETKEPIKIESDNGLKNDRGTVAMARTQDPDSATSQFFINLVNNDFLNYKSPDIYGYGYAVFGKVTEGMETADKIASVPTGTFMYMKDVPKETVTIESVTII